MASDKPQKPNDSTPPSGGSDSMQAEAQALLGKGSARVLDPTQMLLAPKQEVIPRDIGGAQNSDQPSSSKPFVRPGTNQTGLAPSGSEQIVVAPQPVLRAGTDQGITGAPIGRVASSDGPAKAGSSEQMTPRISGAMSAPGASETAVVSGTRTSERATYLPGDSGIKTPVELPAASAPTKSGVFTFTTNENNQVTVARQPQKASETAPGVQNPSSERSVQTPNLAQDGGHQKPLVAPETQPRFYLPGEQSGGQNQPRSVAPERVDVPANAPKGNTGPSVETANFTRPNLGSLENQNQVKPSAVSLEAQSRNVPGVSPDAGSRDLTGRAGLTLPIASGNALDAPGRKIPVAGAEKLLMGLDNRQTPAEAASARVGGPQASLDLQGKQIAGSAPSDTFGARRESGLQLPDTKQSSGRTDSGIQLPDTKQSSGRTDTGGIKLPDARNDTGRNDANTGKLPDAKTLANLDQKFGDKVNPPGKGGGVPIAIPGIPDILGGLRGDKDSKTVKDAKADSQGAKDGAVRSEAPGGRDAKDAKGESPGAKDSKAVDGKGDTKSGVDDKSVGGQKGVRPESDSTTKGPDGKAVQDVRNTTQDGKSAADGRSVDAKAQGGSSLVHDGGSKSDKGHTDVGAGAKGVGSRGDSPFILPPGSLPVPDLVGGIRNIGQQIDIRTGKPIPADVKGSRQPDKIDGTKIDATKIEATKIDAGKFDATKGDASNLDPVKGFAGKTDITKGDPTKGDSVKSDTKGTIGDGVKTIVTGGLRPGDRPTLPGEGKVGVFSALNARISGGEFTRHIVQTSKWWH